MISFDEPDQDVSVGFGPSKDFFSHVHERSSFDY